MGKLEPLLLARQPSGLTPVGQRLNIRVRIPVQWQNNNDVYKNERLSEYARYLTVQSIKQWQTTAYTKLLAKLQSVITNLCSQVVVPAYRQTNPQTNLSFMNQGSGHLFDQEHQRLISFKFRCTFYNLARKLSNQEIPYDARVRTETKLGPKIITLNISVI